MMKDGWTGFIILLGFVLGFLTKRSNTCATPGIVYLHDQLIALRTASLHGLKFDIPALLWKRRRGSRAGVKWCLKQRRFKPCVPTVITGNVRLANKMDVLEALTRTQRHHEGMQYNV